MWQKEYITSTKQPKSNINLESSRNYQWINSIQGLAGVWHIFVTLMNDYRGCYAICRLAAIVVVFALFENRFCKALLISSETKVLGPLSDSLQIVARPLQV